MYDDILDKIDGLGIDIEEEACKMHRPQKGAYVYVKKDSSCIVTENKDRVAFNSKHKGWDYYSQLVSINKPIASKKIQSNNYNAFWCKNTTGISDAEIEEYFYRLGVPDEKRWHVDWVKRNIKTIGRNHKNTIIKIFFDGTREEYRDLGLKNWREKSISVPAGREKKFFDDGEGYPIGYSINGKKPFSVSRVPYKVNWDKGLRIKYIYDILKGAFRYGFNIVYMDESGIFYTNEKQGAPNKMIQSGIIIAFKFNNKGEIDILDYDIVTSYNPKISDWQHANKRI